MIKIFNFDVPIGFFQIEMASDQASSFGERKLELIRGIPVFDILNRKIIEEALDLEPVDGDVIITSYPKTGTTWMQYIVHQILTKGESSATFNDLIHTIIPHLVWSGKEGLEKLTTRPRVYRHHFPYDKVKKNLKAKIIYVYRKPEDTLISHFYFMNELFVPIKLDESVEDFLSGNIAYGEYFDHILSFVKHKNDGNILFVSYEKLLSNKKEQILRLAEFLGEEYYSILSEDKSVLRKIIENTEFSHMKNNLIINIPKVPDASSSKNPAMKQLNFFRKGKMGEGKKLLTEDQLKCLTERAKEKLKGTDILSEWLND